VISNLTLNFSTTDKDWKLKFLENMKNLMIVEPQKRNSDNINPRIFSSFIPKTLSLLTGRY
jgi:hypothetical protein